MMTEAVETMTEAMVTGQAVAGKVFGPGHQRDQEYEGRGDYYEDRCGRRLERHDGTGPLTHRLIVNVKPQGTPKEDISSTSTSR